MPRNTTQPPPADAPPAGEVAPPVEEARPLTYRERRALGKRAPDFREVERAEAKRNPPVIRWVGEEEPPEGEVSIGMEPVFTLPDAATQRAGFACPLGWQLIQLHRPNYKAVTTKDGKPVEDETKEAGDGVSE